MRCLWCGSQMGSHNVCSKCGRDMTVYRRIIRASNACYNLALEKAKVHDLSGAIPYLRQSLKWNKNNIAARNLLGLLYYEIGEMEDALEEWAISASFLTENNPAVRYLNVIAARQSRVENINVLIRKYNQALHYAKHDSEDMAILQARQIIARNPRHLKAHLLLALLYIKKAEYGKAERTLHRALRIDAANSTALRYLDELKTIAGARQRKRLLRKKPEPNPPQPVDENTEPRDDVLIPAYHETTGSWKTVYTMLLGVLIGGVCVYFLLFPTERRTLQAAANRAQESYFASLNQLKGEIGRLQSEVEEREEESRKLQEELELYTGRDTNAEKYDRLLQVCTLRQSGDDYHAMELLQEIEPTGDLSETFLQTYQELTSEYSTTGAARLYDQGVNQYNAADYASARDTFLMVLKWREDFPEAIFWLGLSYWNLSEQETAAEYLNRVVEEYPDSPLAADAGRVLGGG